MPPSEQVLSPAVADALCSASGGGIQWGMASAIMILAALLPMVLGLVMYRQIAGSMTAGALKG